MNKLEYAITYARAGLKIFPLHWVREGGQCSCGDSNCPNKGKHTIWELAPNSHNSASNDLKIVQQWWIDAPEANIGLSCAASGLFVLDIDLHDESKNGFVSLDDFETTTGEKINSNVEQETGGGGLHLIFKAPEWLSSPGNGLGKNYPGIDFKFNGLILLEPSNHKSGNKYEFTENSMSDFLSGRIPPLPANICAFIKNKQSDDYSPARFSSPRRISDDDDIEQMQEALNCMSATSLNDDELLKVGMGLQQALPGGTGKGMFFDWLHSALGSKFSSKLTERRWRSFKYRSGGRTIASFYEVAASFGFDNKGKVGTYINPDDFVFMEPEKIFDEIIIVDNFKNMFVDESAKILIPEINVNPTIIYIDYDVPPTESEMEVNDFKFPSFGHQFAEKVSNSISSKSLMDEILKLKSGNIDDNVGMPTKEERAEWINRMRGNKVLCSLFDFHINGNTAYIPELAMAFAFSSIGALLAGRFECSGLTTNLYVMVVAETSTGKSITMSMISQMFEFAQEINRLGPKDIVSDKGFINDLIIDKSRFFQLDEIGELFSAIFNPKANSSQKLIKRVILDGFSGFGNSINKTASKADSKTNPVVDIGRISPSILGVTTPAKIFEAMSSKDIIDGLLNRLFVLFNDNKAPIGKLPKTYELPSEFCSWFMQVRNRWLSTGVMPIMGTEIVNKMSLSSDAELVMKAIKNIETKKRAIDNKYGSIWARLAEITIRMSIIFELTNRPWSSEIQCDSVDAAYNVVSWSIEKTEDAARSKIADSEEESIAKEVFEIIDSKNNGIFYHELIDATRLASNNRARNTVITALKDEQKIKEFRLNKKGERGRPKKLYLSMRKYRELSKDDLEGLAVNYLEI